MILLSSSSALSCIPSRLSTHLLALSAQNNLVRYNQGGLHILADSSGLAMALKAHISHSLFSDTRQLPSLLVAGRRAAPYQEAVVYCNYVTRADSFYSDVIEFSQVGHGKPPFIGWMSCLSEDAIHVNVMIDDIK